MPCYESHIEKYELFDNIDEYIKYEDLTEQNGISYSSSVNCSFIQNIYPDYITELTNICKQFSYLIDSLINRSERNTLKDDSDFDYLNYWLNDRIYKIDSFLICNNYFYKNLLSTNRINQNVNKLNGKIDDIEEDVLKNINSLYTFYKNYKEINKTINSIDPKEADAIKYAKICIEEYKKIKDICPNGNAKFCEALSNFKKKYEEIDLCKNSLEGWTKKKLPPLTGEDDTSENMCASTGKEEKEESAHRNPEMSVDVQVAPDIDIQSITIGVIVTTGIPFIFFILNKFTSFGSLLRSRIKKNEKFWENLDDEMNPLSHASDYEHINSENTSYKIAYNSV
ncbi:PIR Superfamily Protein [Plasmodium ovale wallikeri]|uniref:PIR Superfamily Protein n=1 Tax=Plasmodium ovale wallikeri TaxID=864142 RepID=A0A1A8YM30_PLAOA|nr:PIR Superfamily Protein [Plasmodium ovale wallikeri]